MQVSCISPNYKILDERGFLSCLFNIIITQTINANRDHHARKRQIHVQFIPDIPYALTEFGAYIHSTAQDSHVLTDLDVTGLARRVGLR